MKKSDFAWCGALVAYAAFIWLRDRQWLGAADDLLPILAGLPLFVWLKWPFRFAATAQPVSSRMVLLAALFFAGGAVANSTLALAVSWTILLWAWLSVRLVDGHGAALRRLIVLPLFSFPWIATDLERLGWWFRLSGAAAVERVLALGAEDVTRNGTFLLVNGFQLSVEPACSGLNGLQSMLIAGTMLAFIALKNSPLYWASLLALPVAAWLANFLRILSGAVVPLVVEPELAARWVGPLHSATGWFALCAMFALCWVLFSRLARLDAASWSTVRRRLRNAPWLEITILVYAAWRCQALLNSWFTNPFDQFAWLAFALWIFPIGIYAQRAALPIAGSGRRRTWLLGAGVALVCLGDVGALNACKYAGLALVLIGFAPRRGRLLWALTAVAWMPALGWLASRFGIDPVTTAIGRNIIALAGAAWAWWAGIGKFSSRELDYVGRLETTP
jgi:exosortase/archaeosortase family protein